MAYDNGIVDPDTMRAWQEWQGLRDEDIANGLINNKQIRMSPEKNRMFWDNERARIAAMPIQPMGNGGVMPGQGMDEIPPSGRFNNGLPDNSFYEGEWTSPQTQIPYYRNEFEGTLIRRDTNPAGISVADSTADLNRHRAMWAQQNMQPLPIASNISTIANARQALINAHGIAPTQLPVSQQPQLAMNMAANLGIGQRIDPATGQAYTGGLGSHAPIHSRSYLAAQLPEQVRQATIAAHNANAQRAAEQHAIEQNQSIGASYAGYAIPHKDTGAPVLTDKEAAEHYTVGAEAEAQRRGIPVENIIAWRRLGYQLAKANALIKQKQLEPKPTPLVVSNRENPDTLAQEPVVVDRDKMQWFPLNQGGASIPVGGASPKPAPVSGASKIVVQNGRRYKLMPNGTAEYLNDQTGQ